MSHHSDDYGIDRGTCKARFQQSPVEVFARFLAIDQVSVINFFTKGLRTLTYI